MGSVFEDYLGRVLRPTQAKIISCNNTGVTNTGNTPITPFLNLTAFTDVATHGFKERLLKNTSLFLLNFPMLLYPIVLRKV